LKYILALNEDLVRAMQELADWEGISELSMASELVRLAWEKAQPERAKRQLVASLSQRERQVAALFLKGYTRGYIGQKLFISVETVKTHLRNIRMKLGLRTIQEIKSVLDEYGTILERR
jgi:DNA-binding CsgD family transcriptional regulator